MRAALFITCLNDTLFPDAGRATVAVLERLGVDVRFPEDQTCCGQMHVNTGYRPEATALLRRFVRVFSPYEIVVSPSASCVATVRDQYPRLARETGEARLEADVRALVPRVLELSELLVDRLGATDVGAAFPHRVTYHPTCHSLRGLRLGERPRRLLGAVRGLELVDLPDADECCGFGGTFAVKNAATSTAMVDDKAAAVRSTGAEVLVAADTSCLMQIGGALRRRGASVRTLHLAEVLASGAGTAR